MDSGGESPSRGRARRLGPQLHAPTYCVTVVADTGSGRQTPELLRLATAEHDIVGSQRRRQQCHDAVDVVLRATGFDIDGTYGPGSQIDLVVGGHIIRSTASG